MSEFIVIAPNDWQEVTSGAFNGYDVNQLAAYMNEGAYYEIANLMEAVGDLPVGYTVADFKAFDDGNGMKTWVKFRLDT